MKGAIGNALILNIVITFMIIFFSLLIGSMAYSKAYKTKNYLINLIDKYDSKKEGFDYFMFRGSPQADEWDDEVNQYLGKIGYVMNPYNASTCPDKSNYKYTFERGNENGYDYCVYVRFDVDTSDNNEVIKEKYNYMVLVYMKFDFPIIGNFIKIPITGETKSYTILR